MNHAANCIDLVEISVENSFLKLITCRNNNKKNNNKQIYNKKSALTFHADLERT